MTVTTHESIDLATGLLVQYSDATLHSFDRDSLFTSIYEACKHREDGIKVASALVQTVIAKLLSDHMQHATVTRDNIVESTHTTLKHFDAAAASIYKAYHP